MMKKGVIVTTIIVSLLLVTAGMVFAETRPDLNLEQQSLYDQMLKTFIAPDFCGKSLEECPATVTVQMRDGIYEQIKQGMPKEEITNYWTGVYGMKILAAPPKSGFFLSAWLLPLIGILAGAWILIAVMKKRMLQNSGKSSGRAAETYLEYDEELKKEIIKHL